VDATPTVRKLERHEWALYRQLRLAALEESPDAFGSTLAAEQGRTSDDWAARLAEGDGSGSSLPLIAEVQTEPAGLAWARVDTSDPTLVNVYQMWVAPEFRGCGAGRLLLRAAVAWARARSARAVQLGVTLGDTPAMHLYASEGFKPVGPIGILRPGSHLRGQTLQVLLSERAA